MTWGEFKAAVEAQGVTDEMYLRWIDCFCHDEIEVTVDEIGIIIEDDETV